MKDEFNLLERGSVSGNTAARPQPILSVDVEKYQAFLDEADMTEAQKEEFLQALWSIIVSFVEMGFGVHPLQAVCGEEPETDAKDAKDAFNVVGSDQPENDEKTNDFSP
jgi:hypothetical protein